MTVRVAINGYGTIGKRVAEAVSLQEDMEVAGVVKRSPTFEAFMAVEWGFPLYAASKENIKGFEDAGLPVEGTLEELLDDADIVVDCTPKKAGYKELYQKKKIKAIWQGGEKHELTGLSFNAYPMYEKAYGADMLRVVSCNTTGLIRTLYPLMQEVGVKNVLATMIRRAADPWDSKKGPINAIEPVLKIPSHHGPDVQSVLPSLDIQTTAVAVPTTLMHLHSVAVKLEKEVSTDDVLDVWDASPRLIFVDSKMGIKSTAQIMELAKDMERSRGDLYEIAIWEDSVHVVGDMLYYYQAIHQESDVVPENIDAIRAMLQMESDKMKSIEMTDRAMGIINPYE